MRSLYILLLIIFSVTGYSQEDNSEIIKKHNLPKKYKDYLKVEPFIKMLERVEQEKLRYIPNGSKENKIRFNGFYNPKKQECSFEEDVYIIGKNQNIQWRITYYYINQHLSQKSIRVDDQYKHVESIVITFHKNGKVRTIESLDILNDVTTQLGKWNENGNPVDHLAIQDTSAPVIKSKLGPVILSIPDVSGIRMLPEYKLIEVKAEISKLSAGSDFNKVYDEFTAEDWKRFNLIRDYLKKELTMTLYHEADIYLKNFGLNGLTLIDEYGNTYYIGDYGPKEQEWVRSMVIDGPEENLSTSTQFFRNGTVSKVRQYIRKDNKVTLLGLIGEYREDGSVISEINLEKEFKLNSYEVIELLRSIKGINTSFRVDNIKRYLNTNYGNIWEIKYYVSGVEDFIYVDDATKTVYDHFNKYTKRDYKILVGDKDPAILEKEQNTRILVFEEPGS